VTTPAPLPDIQYVDGLFGPGASGWLIAPGEEDFILAEDEALRNLLKGITVADGNNAVRPVGVWFGQPDPEIRTQSYPYVTIDLLSVIENRDQVMTAYGPLDTAHRYSVPETDSVAVRTFSPTPMIFTYQVSSWARNPRHDRQIMSKYMHRVLHPRFAQISASDTARRLVVLSFTKRDTTDENQKRLFRNIWTVQVISELFYAPLDLIRRASAVSINDEAVVPVAPEELSKISFVYPR